MFESQNYDTAIAGFNQLSLQGEMFTRMFGCFGDVHLHVLVSTQLFV